MGYFKLENLTVTDWTLHPDIMALQIRTEDRTEYIVVNYDTMYNRKEWTIEEAIKHYLSEEGKNERFDSWYKAWCD